MGRVLRFAIIGTILLNGLSCKTNEDPTSDVQEQTTALQQSQVFQSHFDQEAFDTLQNFNFDLKGMVARAFIPSFQANLRKRFNDTEANRRSLSDLAFYAKLKQYFPESLLSRVRYVIVDKFPPTGQLLTDSGFDRGQLSSFRIHIEDDVWNFKAAAMTVDKTIYIDKTSVTDASTFFHECVHVVQYDKVGLNAFLTQYADSVIAGVAYHDLSSERMAYFLEGHFDKGTVFNADAYIRKYF